MRDVRSVVALPVTFAVVASTVKETLVTKRPSCPIELLKVCCAVEMR